jgi:hypothetical protein
MRGPMSSSSAAISHSSDSSCKPMTHRWQAAASANCPTSTARRARHDASLEVDCTSAANRLQGDERLGDRRLRLRRQGWRTLLRRLRARAAGTPGQLTCEVHNTVHEPCVKSLRWVPNLPEDRSDTAGSTSSCGCRRASACTAA